MKITIIAVGKIKEKYWRDAIAEYEKRLGKYGKISLIEVEDEKAPDHIGDVLVEQILAKEAQRISKHIKADAYVIALEIKGRAMDSEALAAFFAKQAVDGASHLQFLIGGSLGLHRSLSERAEMGLSFSAFTFPHQMMRVILLEQIYRAFRINAGEPYHK